jgi:hypothetical protein
MYNIIRSNQCLPVYANIPSSKDSYTKFRSWLLSFGWKGDEQNFATFNTGNLTDLAYDTNAFPFIDLLSLLEVGRDIHDLNESPSGLLCPSIPPFNITNFERWYGQKQRGKFKLPICFFSSSAPKWKQRTTLRNDTKYEQRYDTKCEEHNRNTHVALLTYDWMQNTFTTPIEMIRRAIAVTDPELADCQYDIELNMQPPRMLRPVASGELTTPNLHPGLEDVSPMAEPPSVYVPPSRSAPSMLPVPPSDPFLFGSRSPWNPAEQTGAQGAPEYAPVPTKFPHSLFELIGHELLPHRDGDQGLPAMFLQVPGSIDSVPASMVVTIGNYRGVIIRDSDDKKVIIIGSSTITASGPEITIAGHRVQFVGDTVAVDGTSTYQFPASRPAAPRTRSADREDGRDMGMTGGTDSSTRQTWRPVETGESGSSSDQGSGKPTPESKKSLGLSAKEKILSVVGISGAFVIAVILVL